MAKHSDRPLSAVLKQIPLFYSLSPTQLKKILSICQARSYGANEIVFDERTACEDMYVLVDGGLALKKPDGTTIKTLSPVAIVGETGFVTRQPRTTSVVTTSPSTVLSIRGTLLQRLLDQDPGMPIKIYRNMIVVLSTRFVSENVRLSDFEAQKSEIHLLETRLRIAMELMTEQGMSAPAVAKSIANRLREVLPRILVADDEEAIRLLLRSALRAYYVVEAVDGEEALEIIQSDPPALVIADIRMPNVDGVQLLKSIRQQQPKLPVIGLSGYVSPDEGSQLGFNAFVTKPVDLFSLQDLVKANLRNVPG